MGIDNFEGESSVDSKKKNPEELSLEESKKLAPEEFNYIFSGIFSNGTNINVNDGSLGKYFTFSEHNQHGRIDAKRDGNKRILSFCLYANDSMHKNGSSFQLIEEGGKYFSKSKDKVTEVSNPRDVLVYLRKNFRTRFDDRLKGKQERDKQKTMYPGSVAYNIPDQEAADQEEAVKLLNKIEEGLV